MVLRRLGWILVLSVAAGWLAAPVHAAPIPTCSSVGDYRTCTSLGRYVDRICTYNRGRRLRCTAVRHGARRYLNRAKLEAALERAQLDDPGNVSYQVGG
jgi:hypothetical protein